MICYRKENVLLDKQKKLHWKELLDYFFYIIYFLILFVWSLMLRFNDAPDELGRYSICKYIFNHGRLPHGGDMEIRMEAWGFSYAFQPILPYILGSRLMKITSFFTQNTYFYLISARFVSVICGVIMAVFVRKIAKRIFINTGWQWIFTFLVLLLPQCMFMFVYVNTDSMALMSCAIITYAWLCGFDTNWNIKTCLLLSIGIICCAMSYYNAYAFILCSAIIFFVSFLSYNKNKHKISIFLNPLLKKGLLITCLVLIGAGWWFVRSYILYDGDFLGLDIRNEYAEKYATVKHLRPSQAKTYYIAGLSLFRMLKETDYINDLLISFIGQFGNMSIVLHNWIYKGYFILFGFGALGLLLKKRKNIVMIDSKKKDTITFHISMIICILVPIFLCTYSSYVIDYQPQGRYILPMIIPFMIYITIGLNKVYDTFLKNNILYKIMILILVIWFFLVVYFFQKDMVFNYYWDTFINFIKTL